MSTREVTSAPNRLACHGVFRMVVLVVDGDPLDLLVLVATQMSLIGDISMAVNITHLAMEVFASQFLAMHAKHLSFRGIFFFNTDSFILGFTFGLR